ncbi:MAG TPA: hypothetical protein VME24_02980 [Alphaproteobacteria bacterium]|nr:hypothetical protein [Alphaproteobacteria bacterium]
MKSILHNPAEDFLTIETTVFCVEVFTVRIKRRRKTGSRILAPNQGLRRSRGSGRFGPRFL